MASGLDRFFNSVLKDRTDTPLYTSIIISWCIWNPKIIYATLFVSADSLPKELNKLEYILTFWNQCNGIIYPLISAALFIFAFPHAANFTYKTSLKFRRERIDQKTNILHKDRVLSHEESNEIREEAIGKVKRAEDEVKMADRKTTNFQTELTALIKDKQAFKFLYGRYGHDSMKWEDITPFLNNLLAKTDNELKLLVENKAFPFPDPAPGVWKSIIIVYQAREELKTIIANEGDSIIVDVQSHVVEISARSREWYEFESEQRRTLQFGKEGKGKT